MFFQSSFLFWVLVQIRLSHNCIYITARFWTNHELSLVDFVSDKASQKPPPDEYQESSISTARESFSNRSGDGFALIALTAPRIPNERLDTPTQNTRFPKSLYSKRYRPRVPSGSVTSIHADGDHRSTPKETHPCTNITHVG